MVSFYTAGLFATGLLKGALMGAISGGLSTGRLKGVIRGAIFGTISAGAARIIGHSSLVADKGRLFNSNWGTAAAHGVSQGAISRIAGGDFRSGFYGGVISSYSSEFGFMKKSGDGNLMNITKRTATAATLAGAVAHLGGGKFANGAVSGAFVHLFNGEWAAIKLRVGAQAKAMAKMWGVLGVDLEFDLGSANFEWYIGDEGAGFRNLGGSQGANLSSNLYKAQVGYGLRRTHPAGTNDWTPPIHDPNFNVRGLGLDGVYEVQGGLLISPGIRIDFLAIDAAIVRAGR